MKFESVISETKAKREQVWLAYHYNGDQLQLEAKWLDAGIRRLPADYVFLIRVVSICDGCPILLTQAFDSIRHVYLRVITICMLSIITHETLPLLHTHPASLQAGQVRGTDDFRLSRVYTRVGLQLSITCSTENSFDSSSCQLKRIFAWVNSNYERK